MKDRTKLAWLLGVFLAAYFLPIGNPKVSNAILEAFRLLQWYAIHHTLTCVVPAMFIAGAIGTFLAQASVMRYLGPDAGKPTAYAVASVAGMILAVCSCSVLPMFAGIYAMGAGLGPASAFLYSGPAINVMAIFLSARVLGLDLGAGRVAGAVTFAVVIGLAMAALFRRSERQRIATAELALAEPTSRRRWQTGVTFLCMILFLVFSDWYNTGDVTVALKDGTSFAANIRHETRGTVDIQVYGPDGRLAPEIRRLDRTQVAAIKPVPGITASVFSVKWVLAGAMGLLVLLMLWRWYSREEVRLWLKATREFALMIVPLLFIGVFVTGFVGGVIPERAVAALVGGDSLRSSLVASFVGMIWYFATLTEIPIVEMLMRLGMGKGPGLALLLAGPALSLPSILVINRVIGPDRTLAFCLLTVVMSTVVGFGFGMLV
jgi:uncharacterized membrane protein YraQ (UPF0718 family)